MVTKEGHWAQGNERSVQGSAKRLCELAPPSAARGSQEAGHSVTTVAVEVIAWYQEFDSFLQMPVHWG